MALFNPFPRDAFWSVLIWFSCSLFFFTKMSCYDSILTFSLSESYSSLDSNCLVSFSCLAQILARCWRMAYSTMLPTRLPSVIYRLSSSLLMSEASSTLSSRHTSFSFSWSSFSLLLGLILTRVKGSFIFPYS